MLSRQSIPTSSKPKKPLLIKCQNIVKHKIEEQEHILDQLNVEKYNPSLFQQIETFPNHFHKRQKIIKQNIEDFLDQEYPNPQKQKQDNILMNPLVIVKLTKPMDNKDQIPLMDQNDITENATIKEIQQEMNLEHDKYIKEFVENLKQEEENQVIENVIRLPLPELLRIQGSQADKDKFRSLNKKQQEEVKIKHQEVQEQIINQPKLSLAERQKLFEENKVDYFKIIAELDLLNKGARQLQNKTQQQYQLRQKVDPPNTNKYISAVTGNVDYIEGVTKGFDREKYLIAEKTKNIQLNQEALNVVANKDDSEKVKLVDQKQEQKLIMNTSNQSQLTQDSKREENPKTNKISISTKAQMMESLLDNSLF